MSKLVLTSSALLLLLCVWVNLSQSMEDEGPVRCCTMYSSHSLPLNRLTTYSLQDTTMACNIKAVIFTTVKNRQVCANPDEQWVQKAISHIQSKKKSA